MEPSSVVVSIVEDDFSARRAVEGLLRAEGFATRAHGSAHEFLASLSRDNASCLVLDIGLPDFSGLDLQQRMNDSGLQIPIIFLTGRADIPLSVRAIKAGAVEFLTKPYQPEALVQAVRQAVQSGDLPIFPNQPHPTLVGRSAAIGQMLQQISLVSRTDATVLISGESGTGKEMVARAIHDDSPRCNQPMVKVNCGAVPESLFESEFFGHVRGAFTGALRDKPGRFELAHGGTLFLDEIGEVPLSMQAKLLRVLQEREIERIGDTRSRPVNVRIVAATNRDLAAEVKTGRFRQDLFYRLNVFPINLPPLRERRADIPLLAEHFLRLSVKNLRGGQRAQTKLTEPILQQLTAYDWPGNIRELQNTIERAVIVANGGPIRSDMLPAPHPTSTSLPFPAPAAVMTRDELKLRERNAIIAALAQTRGKVSGPNGAAELLGMKTTTLYSRIAALGLERKPAPAA